MAQRSNMKLYVCTLFAILCSRGIVSQVWDNAGTVKRPSTEFTSHTIIMPKLFHGRAKREIKSTQNSVEGGHIKNVTIEYDVNGTHYVLDVLLNQELVSERFSLYYRRNGQNIAEPLGRDVGLCDYQGHVRGVEHSWVAISTCSGISGVVFDGEELFYLEPGFGGAHLLYKHSDITTNQTCGTMEAPHHIAESNEAKETLRLKRSPAIVRGPYNANDNSRYVELELIVDNQIYVTFGRSSARVQRHCKELVNIVNRLYQSLNIFIVLIGIVIWTEREEIPISRDSLDTLQNFVSYRKNRLMEGFHSDNGQLLTLVKFDGGVLGKAFIQTICQLQRSSGINVMHSSLSGLVAQTVAHEMGHNFGMDHDSKEHCDCDGCLMAASSNNMGKPEWSSCSMNYLADTFNKGKDFCLKNKPIRTMESPVCGNGFVEAGEQCDCGLADVCKNTCCDASSCRLFSNASCATGECCDMTTCSVKAGGNLCRPTQGRECDLPEYCTGEGEYCPDDVFKADGLSCDEGAAFCYHGDCPSRASHCRLLWGPQSESADICYKGNIEGNPFKNCGYDQYTKAPVRCQEQDVKCGRLQCAHTNRLLVTDWGAEPRRWYTLDDRGTVDCRAVSGSPELVTLDLGLVPNGAKCGDDKICITQKCVPLSSLQQRNCSTNCNGNGICNSKGNCHCDSHFAPPFCNTPGFGGSIDSGVVKDLGVFKYFAIGLYVLFLGIVPLSALVFIIVYYKRHQHSPSRKRPSSKSPHLCNDVQDCCCGNLCNRLHTYMLCGRSSHKVPSHGSGNALTTNQSRVGRMSHKPGPGSNDGKVLQQKGLAGTHTGNLSGNTNGSAKSATTYRMSFNEKLKKFNSIKRWKTGVVEMSVINLPGLNSVEHKSDTSSNTKSGVPELSIEFHPSASSHALKPTHVQNRKLFFEAQDSQGSTSEEKTRRMSSEQALSKSSLLRKNSKGLQLNIEAAKSISAKTKILKTGDSDVTSTPETPPVEKYLRSIRGMTKEPVKKEGYGLSNSGYAITPPPPPPSAFKPRF